MADTRSSSSSKVRHWADWTNVVAGLWLFISPAILGITAGLAAWNAWIVGAVITVVALLSLSEQRAEWINVAAAVWLVLSPWILAFATETLAWSAWIVGVVVFFVALAGALKGSHESGTYAAHGV